MWWLTGADLALPVGDIIYFGGIAILGLTAIGASQNAKNSSPIKSKSKAKTKEKAIEEPETKVHQRYNYWSAEIIKGVVTPLVPLTYSDAMAWASSEKNLLCMDHAAAIAIVKFFPSARWEPAHRGGLACGYLNHYHLSTAHKNHIWYYGV